MCACGMLSNTCISLLAGLLHYIKSYGFLQSLASQAAKQLAGAQTASQSTHASKERVTATLQEEEETQSVPVAWFKPSQRPGGGSRSHKTV